MAQKLVYNDFDREFWESELEDFVPDKLYDMHTHLWTNKGQEHLEKDDSPLRDDIDFEGLDKWSEDVFPGRKCHYLCLGTPIKGLDVKNHNDWLAGEISKDCESAFSMIVTPESTPEELDRGFSKQGFNGVKPYRLFAKDPKNARINEFLPENQLEVINHYGKAVTLHMSIPEGPDSPENIADLQKFTKKYPNVKWILAHCARAFNSVFLTKSIFNLKNIPNIWYDTSAVNDLYTHVLLLKNESLDRIMFGSDNVGAGCARGKYITRAKSWEFSGEQKELEHCDSRLTLVVYEQLLQQKQAASILEMTESQIEDLFYNNAKNFISSTQ